MSTKKKKRPRDLNLLAQSIIEDATPEDRRSSPEEGDHMITPKNPHAVELGRLGGLKGGKVRAQNLSPEERSEIARKAAKARWAKKQEEAQNTPK